MSVLQVCYRSRATKPMSSGDVAKLLKKARANNQALGLSGLLLYHTGIFIQLLEGAESDVIVTYDKIKRDPLHTDIVLLLHETVDQPSFPNWDMGCCNIGDEELRKLPNYSRFLKGAFDPESLQQGDDEVRALFRQFSEGLWRKHVETGGKLPTAMAPAAH